MAYKYRKTFTFDGKRYDIRANTKKELNEKYISKMQELEEGIRRVSKRMLFKDWAEEWLATYKEPTVSAESMVAYRNVMKNHIIPTLGNMSLMSIRSIHCQRVLNEMQGYSKKMINRVRNLQYRCLEDAVANGLILENPARNLKAPKGEAKTRRALTPTERRYVILTASKHRAGLWVKFMLYCGLRPSEAAALQWYNVDFKKGMLNVDSNMKRLGGRGSTKTAAGVRSVPIRDEFLDELRKIKGEPFDYILKNTRGQHLTSESMKSMWKSFINALNIEMGCQSFKGKAVPPYRAAEDLVPYYLRHTFCTELRDLGVDITIAKDLMGHSDISTTAKIYTHSTDEAVEKARALMNSLPQSLPHFSDELDGIGR